MPSFSGQLGTMLGALELGLGAQTQLYPSVAEIITNDATFIRSPIAPSNAAVMLRLGTTTAPGAGADILKVRLGKDFAGGEPITQIVDLMQGASVLQTWTFTDVAAGEATQELTITPGAVTDWTIPLDVRITANQA